MNNKRGQTIVEHEQTLRAQRSVYDQHCQEIARLMLPGSADFTSSDVPGSKRLQDMHDGTAGIALDNLASGLWGTITNSANRWFMIQHADESVKRRHDVKLWCAAATNAMMQALAGDGQRFYAEAIGNFRSLAAFGTGPFFVEQPDPTQRKIAFSAKRLSTVVVAENDRHMVDTVYEKFKFTARQASQRKTWRLPDELTKAAEKEPHRQFEFIFATLPAKDWDGKLPRRDMTHAGVYVNVETGAVIEEGGFYAMPWQVSRWSRASGHPYGDAPAMMALPDTKMVNAMSKTTIVAAQKAADPPVLAPDEGGFRGTRMVPGQFIYGGVDNNGRALYQPFQTGGQTGLALDLADQRRKAIKDAFYATLLLMVENPGMTATEWLGRQEEKLRLMGPHIGLVQAEWLDPMLDTVFVIMARASMPFWARGMDGWLPRPPDAIAMSPELKIEFVSPLARAQKASDAAAVDRWLASVAPIIQVKPEAADNIDTDATVRVLGEGFAVPEQVLRDPELVAQDRASRAKQAQMQNLAALAGPAKDGASALKSLTEAAAVGNGLPRAAEAA